MKIHIRTKIVSWWSYVESAVIQIGDDTLEVMGGFKEKKYWVNGKPGPKVVDSSAMPFTIGGHKVRFRVRSDTQFQFKVFLENRQEIILRAVEDFMKVDIEHHTAEAFDTVKGLMGTYNEGDMLARDGVTILEDANQFGMEWQVQQDEPKLFREVSAVQAPMQCKMPTMTASAKRNLRRRLGEILITSEDAALACARVSPIQRDACIFDVLATNDEGVAGSY